MFADTVTDSHKHTSRESQCVAFVGVSSFWGYFKSSPNNRRQPREWVAEFVKAGLPEDFSDRLVRHLKKGKTNFNCGRACNALMRLFKLYPVSVIYQALSTRLEYGNVTYQETRKRCEQIIWAKENNQEPNIGNDQRVANDYLSPTHANIRNNYR